MGCWSKFVGEAFVGPPQHGRNGPPADSERVGNHWFCQVADVAKHYNSTHTFRKLGDGIPQVVVALDRRNRGECRRGMGLYESAFVGTSPQRSLGLVHCDSVNPPCWMLHSFDSVPTREGSGECLGDGIGGQRSVADHHADGVDKSRVLGVVPGVEFERHILTSHHNSQK